MCIQICYDYPRCGCHILGHMEECEYGRADPRCYYLTTTHKKPIAANCRYRKLFSPLSLPPLSFS